MKSNKLLAIWSGIVLFFLLFPFAVIVYASFTNSALVTIPLEDPGINSYLEILQSGRYVKSLMLSLKVAFFATLFGVTIGTFSSFVIVRKGHVKIVSLINNLLLAPMMVPAVIIGIAIMISISKLGINMSQTLLIMVHTVIVLPYVVRTVCATLSNFDVSIEEASIVMGAKPWHTLLEISIPNIRSGIITSALLAFISSFGEVIITAFILPIGMTTLPVEIMNTLLYNFSPSIAAIAVLVSFGVFTVLYILFRLFPKAFVEAQ
ncbi:MAG TPA: hypothetical protein DEP23_00660 [Ruminococcaceae bacterium]|nr:hypothetical protein [Oscillospiraceae bacterium]